jgi:hypothetical protein
MKSAGCNDLADRATDLLRERLFECAAREISDLVRSGEAADIIASAAMTLCSREIDETLLAFVNARKIETGQDIGFNEGESIKTTGRSALRERVLAMTVSGTH